MVYVDSDELKYLPYVRTWIQMFDESLLIPEMKEFLLSLFETHLDDGFSFIKKSGAYSINQVNNTDEFINQQSARTKFNSTGGHKQSKYDVLADRQRPPLARRHG